MTVQGSLAMVPPTDTTFSPNATITRAEIAALITRTLARFDPNADGGFNDVLRSDWFFGAAGSASRHGIMGGTSAVTFEPRVNIPKDQIVAVSARVLSNEMRFRDPARTMTRGDAAIILHRMFMRIW